MDFFSFFLKCFGTKAVQMHWQSQSPRRIQIFKLMFTHFERSVRLKECFSENSVYVLRFKIIFFYSFDSMAFNKKRGKKIFLRFFVNIFITFQKKMQLN